MLDVSVAFIGYGRMGSALGEGAIGAKVLNPKRVTVYTPSRKAVRKGLIRAESVAAAVRKADLVFLCMKPQQMTAALEALAPALNERKTPPCVVSIAAGVTLDRLQSALPGVPLVRVMPNTPALLGAGISGVSFGPRVRPAQARHVKSILGAVGEVVVVPEAAMDAVTAISGSGPAYVFYLAEALIDAAVLQGLGPDVARRLVHQTVFGAGRMLRERKEPANELRRQVTSPGGTTAAAIASFDEAGLRATVASAVDAAVSRSKELARA